MKRVAKTLLIILLAGALIPVWGEEAQQPALWAQEPVEKLKAWGRMDAPWFSDYQRPLTRLELASLTVVFYEALSGREAAGISDEVKSTFKDTQDTDVLTVWQLGLVSGDGNGNFRPDAPVSREEMACIIVALAQKSGKPLEKGARPLQTYKDGASVSSWADSALRTCLSHGILTGHGNHRLAPQEAVTREQAYSMLAKLMALKGSLNP